MRHGPCQPRSVSATVRVSHGPCQPRSVVAVHSHAATDIVPTTTVVPRNACFPGRTDKHFKKGFNHASSSVSGNDTQWYSKGSVKRAGMLYPELFMTLIAVQPVSQNAALIQALRGSHPARDAAELQEMLKNMFCHGRSISTTTISGLNTYNMISAWTPQFEAFK